MGNNRSRVVSHRDSFVVISIARKNRIRAMNVPPDVLAMLTKLDEEIRKKTGQVTKPLNADYYGTAKMQVGSGIKTFSEGSSKENGILGKFFVIRLFEEMYALGYNLVVSSDLTQYDGNATWFFTKSQAAPANTRVLCIAPGGASNDKLTLLRYDDQIKQSVLVAISDCWPKGIADMTEGVAAGEKYCEIKLNGIWGHIHEDGVNTRKLICNMVGRLGGLNWRFIAATNLKDTTDSYFFMYDPTYTAHPNDMVMISLSKMDRLRLINCNELFEQLKAAVGVAGLTVQEDKEYFGCMEVKIKGKPWHSIGHEAIRARRAISRVVEMMAANGFVPYCAINFSKRLTDKDSLLFKRESYKINCRVACLALTGLDRMSLLDFPIDVAVAMKDCIRECYPLGLASENEGGEGNLKVKLQGRPWYTKSRGESYHAKAMLGKMMRVAEENGWTVIMSGDMCRVLTGKGSSRVSIDVHTIYFINILPPN